MLFSWKQIINWGDLMVRKKRIFFIALLAIIVVMGLLLYVSFFAGGKATEFEGTLIEAERIFTFM